MKRANTGKGKSKSSHNRRTSYMSSLAIRPTRIKNRIEPRKFLTLEPATQYRPPSSKGAPFPFVIRHECNIPYTDEVTGEKRVRKSEYYAFDHVDQFLEVQDQYPYSHEVIFARSEDKAQGRLIFDFDIEEKRWKSKHKYHKALLKLRKLDNKYINDEDSSYEDESDSEYVGEDDDNSSNEESDEGSNNETDTTEEESSSESNTEEDDEEDIEDFVAPTFKEDIEWCVKETFDRFYKGVNTEEFRFIWLSTPYKHKFSVHLIVCGAYFCNDWVAQMQSYYSVFKIVANRSHRFDYLINRGEEAKNSKWMLFDDGMASNNHTFRICGCKKIGGERIERDDESHSMYDTFVQLHRPQETNSEQYITEEMFKTDRVIKIRPKDEIELAATRHIPAITRVLAPKPERTILEDDVLDEVLELMEDLLNTCYKIRSTDNGIIQLKRTTAYPCPIDPERIHGDGSGGGGDNAYVIVRDDGDVRFYCYRGCTTHTGSKSISLGQVMELPDDEKEEKALIKAEIKKKEEENEEEKKAKEIARKAKITKAKAMQTNRSPQGKAAAEKRKKETIRRARNIIDTAIFMGSVI